MGVRRGRTELIVVAGLGGVRRSPLYFPIFTNVSIIE